jgi:hypothetical protein
MKPSDRANPDCPDCGGEGICHYARGEDSYTDLCDTCYPNMNLGDLEEDDAYDRWRDSQFD